MFRVPSRRCASIAKAFALLAATLTALTAAPARAQSDPRIFLPFDNDQRVDLSLDAFVFSQGNAEAGGYLVDRDADNSIDDASTTLTMFEGRGRVGLDQGDAPIRIGFDATHIDLGISNPELSGDLELIDHAAVVGFPLGEYEEIQVAALVGVGFAGDDAYGNSNAWYAKADLIFNYVTDEVSSVQLILDYNGNRTIFPDLPLPAIAYTHIKDEQLTYTIGIPYSSIHWEPADRLAIDIRFTLPYNFDVSAEYELFEGVFVYGAFDNRRKAFHIDGDDRHRRYFFIQRRLEAGVRWQPVEQVEVRVGGGWAFDQEFRRGFDGLDDDELFEMSDEPYLRIGGSLSF